MNEYALIDRLGLTERKYFPDKTALEKLTFEEHFRAEFNVLAFILGPLFYFFSRMWLKGFFLTILAGAFLAIRYVLIASEVIPNPFLWFGFGRVNPDIITVICLFIPMMMCGLLANYDRYRKIRFKEQFWPIG